MFQNFKSLEDEETTYYFHDVNHARGRNIQKSQNTKKQCCFNNPYLESFFCLEFPKSVTE
jgi:hypothetical protein